jgi:hypothetical protein
MSELAPSLGAQAAAIEPDLGGLIDPEPLVRQGRNWTRWAGPLLSVLILAAVAYQLRHLPLRAMAAMLPASAGFWIAFAGFYLALPVSEWIIFRRLWDFPLAGFPALLRKLVSNEILLGYLGEVYFYAWARRHARVSAAPFGAIKDVSILSAVTGNGVTLVMILAALPFASTLPLGGHARLFLLSIAFLLLSSVAIMLLRGRLFTLPPAELRFTAAVHLVRIAAMILIGAWLWHLLLPAVGIAAWLLLATVRQLITRLPFVPDKELVFAGLVALAVGRDVAIVSATALIAGLVLAAHIGIGALLGGAGLVAELRGKP